MSKPKHKLYDHEITPPAGAWDKIALSLDESETDRRFPAQLYNANITPPAYIWNKIAAGLDSTEFGDTLPSKLYAMEVAPPAMAWEKIATALGPAATAATPVRQIRHFWRYAAAAVLIGAVAFAIIRTTVQDETESIPAFVTTTKNTNIAPGETNITTNVPEVPAATVSAAESKPKKLMAATTNHRRAMRTVSVSHTSTVQNEERVNPTLAQSIYAYADHIPDVAERYVMLMTPDGNIIRMSKKWTPLLCCVSGEDQDAGCKDQLKKWQEKIAASSLAPSPSNFMDILGLVNALDESNDL
jgi:hypothetical protein